MTGKVAPFLTCLAVFGGIAFAIFGEIVIPIEPSRPERLTRSAVIPEEPVLVRQSRGEDIDRMLDSLEELARRAELREVESLSSPRELSLTKNEILKLRAYVVLADAGLRTLDNLASWITSADRDDIRWYNDVRRVIENEASSAGRHPWVFKNPRACANNNIYGDRCRRLGTWFEEENEYFCVEHAQARVLRMFNPVAFHEKPESLSAARPADRAKGTARKPKKRQVRRLRYRAGATFPGGQFGRRKY